MMVNNYELVNDDDEMPLEWEVRERIVENQARLLERI